MGFSLIQITIQNFFILEDEQMFQAIILMCMPVLVG
jgi:hypothetical protein